MAHYKKASEWRPKFLTALRNSGNVRASCNAADVPRRTAYNHKNKSKEFAADWDEAVEDACDYMEGEAFRRAMQGVEKPVTVAGEREIIKDYSDSLLMFLLKAHRPGKFRERVEHTGDRGGPVVLHVVYDDDEDTGRDAR
jgi:hypothetical protein